MGVRSDLISGALEHSGSALENAARRLGLETFDFSAKAAAEPKPSSAAQALLGAKVGAGVSDSERVDSAVQERFGSADGSAIKTAYPLRTLIRIPGYGDDPLMAHKMERIIAESRDEVLSGSLRNREELRHHIASRYTTEVLQGELIPENLIYQIIRTL